MIRKKDRMEPSSPVWLMLCMLMVFYAVHAFLVDKWMMSDRLIRTLLEHRIETFRTDFFIVKFRALSRWSILLSPLLLVLRLTFLTFWIQAPLMLKEMDLTFKTCYRVIVRAQFAHLALSIFQAGRWIVLKPSTLDAAMLGMIPFSLLSVFKSVPSSNPLYPLLGQLNAFEAVWITLVAEGLVRPGRLERQFLYPTVSLLWFLLILFQWTIGTVFIQWLQ